MMKRLLLRDPYKCILHVDRLLFIETNLGSNQATELFSKRMHKMKKQWVLMVKTTMVSVSEISELSQLIHTFIKF